MDMNKIFSNYLSLWLFFSIVLQTPLTNAQDIRKNFQIDVFVGILNNTFSPSDKARYINPEEAEDSSSTSPAFDIQFQYRMKKNLWLIGHTVRTKRQAEIDCSKSTNISCDNLLNEGVDLNDAINTINAKGLGKALGFIKNARSIEGQLGLRYEFDQVGLDKHTSKVYIAPKLGFASVDGVDDLADIHQIMIGLIADGDTRFINTYFEIGYGKNDLFIENNDKRFLVNTRLFFYPSWLNENEKKYAIFLESNLDTDFNDGPDSFRTRAGVEIKI